jgi:hypothetical protein
VPFSRSELVEVKDPYGVAPWGTIEKPFFILMRMTYEDRMSQDVFTYSVDHTDTIVDVSHTFYSFADKNDWRGRWRPEDVIGQSLGDFLQDPEALESVLRISFSFVVHRVPAVGGGDGFRTRCCEREGE